MKSNSAIHWLAVAAVWSIAALGFAPAYAQSGSYIYGPYASGQSYFSQEQIDQLVAPIALYPDPILAQMLAAAAYPGEISAANQFVGRYRDPYAIDQQSWDPSVRAVAHYPSALNWLASDLGRTQALGIANINQPDMVANAIQRWRAQAYALGNLYSTSQQIVYVDGDYVRIVPAEPTVIYVPYYEPQVIYVERYRPNYPFLTFGLGFIIGTWLDLDWDWRRHRYYYCDRNRYVGGRPIFYPQFDRIYVDRDREWRPEPSRFRPPAYVVYPFSSNNRVVAPPLDRKPRDGEKDNGPGSTTLPRGRGASIDNSAPIDPGKAGDGDRGRGPAPKDQRYQDGPGQPGPGTTIAPPPKPAPIEPVKPATIDRGKGGSDGERGKSIVNPPDRGPGQPQGKPATDNTRTVTPPPGPSPGPAPGPAPKKAEPKDDPNAGKGGPNRDRQ